MLDFDSLTYDNFYVEKAFKMPGQKTTFQGMAVFNDYMFQCHHSNNRTMFMICATILSVLR